LLGELLNAQGDLADAHTVLDSCSWAYNYNPMGLRDHRQILDEARPKAVPPASASWLPDTQKLIVVGGVAGLIVLLLAYLQVRELRRRRQATYR
jgi:hypothetical protein